MWRFIVSLILFYTYFHFDLPAQCSDYNGVSKQSNRIVSYDLSVSLNLEKKTITGDQKMVWYNPSSDTIYELRFYMYLNAFRDLNSTFIKGGNGRVFGADITTRPKDEFGKIELTAIWDRRGYDLSNHWSYIQPNDHNQDDATVLELSLTKPVLPGESLKLSLSFEAKMPKIIARAGYSKNDYYLFVHWFPKPGVYQQNEEGNWSWNCHQFFQQTEFYANFGEYRVAMRVPDHLVLGATGCLVEQIDHADHTTTYVYEAYDVIDFAWVVYPDFIDIRDTWSGIDVRLLIPPEHKMLANRYFQAIEYALIYLENHVGPYPYPTITIVDPPLHALKSGLMEYPMLITCGSFYHAPDNLRTIESLAIHEFTHMYFMATLASNEKEEAWVDEGFVTYFEDRILDHYFGDNCSLFDIMGYRSGNAENSRLEYTRLPNPNVGIIARPGWEFKTSYKGLVYSKTATILKTLENLIGNELMDQVIKTYYKTWKFKHPRGSDFIAIANEIVKTAENSPFPEGLDWFFQQCIYEAKSCDYRIRSITNIPQKDKNYLSIIEVENLGKLQFPVDIELTFADGTKVSMPWDATKNFDLIKIRQSQKVVSAYIDPQQKIFLDLDLNNNSMTLNHNHRPTYRFGAKTVLWLQNLLQWTSTMM